MKSRVAAFYFAQCARLFNVCVGVARYNSQQAKQVETFNEDSGSAAVVYISERQLLKRWNDYIAISAPAADFTNGLPFLHKA